MRIHKKTKESGYFEGDSDTDMGKALKRTKVFTTSSDYKQKELEKIVEYTSEELDTHIRPTKYSSLGICQIILLYITYRYLI